MKPTSARCPDRLVKTAGVRDRSQRSVGDQNGGVGISLGLSGRRADALVEVGQKRPGLRSRASMPKSQ